MAALVTYIQNISERSSTMKIGIVAEKAAE